MKHRLLLFEEGCFPRLKHPLLAWLHLSPRKGTLIGRLTRLAAASRAQNMNQAGRQLQGQHLQVARFSAVSRASQMRII